MHGLDSRPMALRSRHRYLDDLFADVFGVEQTDEGPGSILEALHDRLSISQLSGLQPLRKLRRALFVASSVVEDEEALSFRALFDQLPQQRRAELGLIDVVLRDLTTDADAGVDVHHL